MAAAAAAAAAASATYTVEAQESKVGPYQPEVKLYDLNFQGCYNSSYPFILRPFIRVSRLVITPLTTSTGASLEVVQNFQELSCLNDIHRVLPEFSA